MVGKRKKPDAPQGTLDLLVLKTLSREPQHGYSVAARIQQITDDALRVEEGSLYPALHRMEQAGWIAAAPAAGPSSSRMSSIFLRRIVGAMVMRVNSKCAHQVRPPHG